MSITNAERDVLLDLSKHFKKGYHFPCDTFQESTIASLEKKGLVEIYHFASLANGAVRLTAEGEEYLKVLI